MSANTTPLFTLTPNFTYGQTVATANTAKDGTGTVVTVLTAGANGDYVNSLTFQPAGTNIASVGRVFLNNGSTNTVAANNTYLGDITLAATTNSEVAAIGNTQFIINRTIPAGAKLLVTVGTSVAAGFALSPKSESF